MNETNRFYITVRMLVFALLAGFSLVILKSFLGATPSALVHWAEGANPLFFTFSGLGLFFFKFQMKNFWKMVLTERRPRFLAGTVLLESFVFLGTLLFTGLVLVPIKCEWVTGSLEEFRMGMFITTYLLLVIIFLTQRSKTKRILSQSKFY